MKAFSRSAIEFDGRTFGPGVFDVSEAEFAALGLRGPVRPATGEEAAAAPVGADQAPESAAARPSTEAATARRAARPRREVLSA